MLFENIKTIENYVQKMKHTEHILNFRDLKKDVYKRQTHPI